MTAKLDLYHRTTEEAARAIVSSGVFITRENTPEAFVSTHVDGQAVGYGLAVVHVRVDEEDAQLEDEFPDGEQHYRIPLDRAEVVEAFTLSPNGERCSLQDVNDHNTTQPPAVERVISRRFEPSQIDAPTITPPSGCTIP